MGFSATAELEVIHILSNSGDSSEGNNHKDILVVIGAEYTVVRSKIKISMVQYLEVNHILEGR